jgi:hypothetical protein
MAKEPNPECPQCQRKWNVGGKDPTDGGNPPLRRHAKALAPWDGNLRKIGGSFQLPQLRVLGFGSLIDGNIGIGVLPYASGSRICSPDEALIPISSCSLADGIDTNPDSAARPKLVRSAN